MRKALSRAEDTKWKLWVAGMSFVALFLIWPNLIHEPLHLLALKAQGSSGFISFGWHPSTTRTSPVAGIPGGLLFALLPSIVSVALLFFLWKTASRAGLLTHIIVPIYLAADLVINIGKFASAPYSDFKFLIAVPGGGWLAFFACIVIATFAITITIKSMKVLEVHNELKLFASDN